MRRPQSAIDLGKAGLVATACLGLLCWGCKKESPAPGGPPEKTPTPEAGNQPHSHPRSVGTNAALQAAIDTMAELNLEQDAVMRPLPVSAPAPTPYDWAVHVLRDGYLRTGMTNAQWDGPVLEAFEAYSDLTRNMNSQRALSITGSVTRARSAGCRDPMLQYLFARYCPGEHNQSAGTYALALVKACRALGPTPYHPGFKVLVGLRATGVARSADRQGSRGPLLRFVNVCLQDFARDTNAPPTDVFRSAFEWADFTRSKGWTDFVMKDLDPLLEANWPKHASLFELRGQAELQRAWEARGGSWAETVSEAGWEGFQEHLAKAEKYLTRSWSLNSSNATTAYRMMQLELGQGEGRSRMEEWFERTMKLSPNNFDAVKLMSFYLEPRWYGSDEDSLDFARTCVTNTLWGGEVPLILANVHHSLAKFYKQDESPEYWHRSEVWRDIKSSYERFFELNPSQTGWRHDYARDAYRCGQHSVFLAQTKLFNTGTNYEFFGGQARYADMLRTAERAVASK